MELEHEEMDGLEVEVSVNTNIPIVELSIGNNTVCLSVEEAMQVAEALAEAAGILENLIEGKADAEPVDVNTHQAPKIIQ